MRRASLTAGSQTSDSTDGDGDLLRSPTVREQSSAVQAPDDGYEGQTCSVFDLQYSLVAAPQADSGWLIDRAAGDPPTPC